MGEEEDRGSVYLRRKSMKHMHKVYTAASNAASVIRGIDGHDAYGIGRE